MKTKIAENSELKKKIYEGITHLGFADEHNYHAASGRYGSLALVTLAESIREQLEDNIAKILEQADITDEFKWEKTKDSKYKKAAIGMIELAVNQSIQNHIRIDVLVWDYYDERHSIRARDNIQNYHRMYHHLLKNTLSKFWPDNSTWIIFPDEITCVKWEDVQAFINGKSLRQTDENLYEFAQWLKSFHVRMIQQVSSTDSPITQLADLFAGISAYSRNKYKTIKSISSKKEGPTLFKIESDEKISRNDLSRFEIIDRLLKLKRKHKLGISFDSFKGLKSPKPSRECPINFWWYEPQHGSDKAPVRQKRKTIGFV